MRAHDVVAAAAEDLSNTPAGCRTSYVHDSAIAAFENDALPRLVKPDSSPAEHVAALAKIVVRHG